jgi:type IV secretory pathway VirB2 component (pilin)
MNWTEVLTIIISILVPMMAGFSWIISKLSDLDRRLTIVETILAMMGAPIKEKR